MATENAVKKLKKDQKAQRKLGSLKTTTSDEREVDLSFLLVHFQDDNSVD